MAKQKQLFNIQGRNLTEHEKMVYDKLVAKQQELGRPVSVVDILDNESNKKSYVATVARLEKTHGLLKKHEPQKMVTYEINEDLESE